MTRITESTGLGSVPNVTRFSRAVHLAGEAFENPVQEGVPSPESGLPAGHGLDDPERLPAGVGIFYGGCAMKGVVVCSEPLAALAGAHALRLGGSVFDGARRLIEV
jgi:hypothetical protein